MAALPVVRCESAECAKEFVPRREWQKFCSTKCRMDHANGRRKAGLKLLGAQTSGIVERLKEALSNSSAVVQEAGSGGVAMHPAMSASALST